MQHPLLVAAAHHAGEYLRPRLCVEPSQRPSVVGVGCQAVQEHDPVGGAIRELLLERGGWQDHERSGWFEEEAEQEQRQQRRRAHALRRHAPGSAKVGRLACEVCLGADEAGWCYACCVVVEGVFASLGDTRSPFH